MKNFYLFAGCNGAGKTTAAFSLLPQVLGCREFVNADEIARGLSPFRPETVSVQAGRLMLGRLQELLAAGESLALETTLATRIYLPIIEQARARGYTVSLFFFWLPSAEMAMERVRYRVREGGHSIPDDVIRRRYVGGLQQFFRAYCLAVDSWLLVNNSVGRAQTIAKSSKHGLTVVDASLWKHLTNAYPVMPEQVFLADDLTANVEAGLATPYNAMLAFKKYKTSPVVIARGEQILHVAAEEMPPAEAGHEAQ